MAWMVRMAAIPFCVYVCVHIGKRLQGGMEEEEWESKQGGMGTRKLNKEEWRPKKEEQAQSNVSACKEMIVRTVLTS